MAMPGWFPMAGHQDRLMRINWVFADGYQLDPVVEPERLKGIGPTWGSWRTWRSCSTDNVICHDLDKSTELVGRALQAVCNFYVPQRHYQSLNRPLGIKLYDSEFAFEIPHVEDVIALHLVKQSSDIVLMLGFDLSTPVPTGDKLKDTQIKHYHGMIRSAINGSPDTQWVLVDHSRDLDKAYQNLTNLTCDTMANALQLLV